MKPKHPLLKRAWMLSLLLLPVVLFAQKSERQVGDTTYYKTLIPEDKQGLLKNVSFIANQRYAFRNEFNDGSYTGSRFVMEQFRMEFRGQVHKKVYFRFRNRFTKTQEPQSVDNLSHSIDIAMVRVDVTDKWSISAGKLCADWGGYEFDLNPIDVYQYSDIIDYADNFLAGVGVSYKMNSNNQFTAQVLNSRTKTFNEIYGPVPNITESKVPLAFVANWRGNMLNGKFKPIWSYSVFTEAEGTFMHYVTLGNQFQFGKFTLQYDLNLYFEDLDRTGIVSDAIPDTLFGYRVQNTRYIGNWLHLQYRMNEHINLAVVGMVEVEDWMDAPGGDDRLRTAWGYIPTFEYYPIKNFNLRFYVNWVGRVYNYSDNAERNPSLGVSDYTTGRLAIGLVTPLAIF